MAKAAKRSAKRTSWFDDKKKTPLIDGYAKQLDSFMKTMADGKVDQKEIRAQEVRLISLMEEIEPKLSDAMHEKITQLLCELTAYDLMQMVAMMQKARPKSVFRG